MSLLKKGLLVSAASYITLFCGLLQTMIVSRAMGPELMGQMSLIRQVALFAAQIGSLGLPMGVVYFINKMKYPPSLVVSSALHACNILSVLSSIIMCLLLYFFPAYFGNVEVYTYIICSGYILFANSRQVLHYYNISRINAKKIVAIDILPVFISFVPLVVLYFSKVKFSVDLVLLFDLLLVPLTGFVLVYVLTRKELTLSYNIDKEYIKKAVPYGFMFNLTDFLVLFNSGIALLMLKYFSDDFKLLGYYSRGVRLATIINVSFSSFLRLLYAHWANLEGEKRSRSVESVLNLFLYSAIVVCILIYLFTNQLVIVLFGREYLPAVGITRIILIGTFGNLVAQIMQRLFLSDGNARLNLIYLLSGAGSNIILCLIFIPMFHQYGAAFGQVGGYLIMGIVAFAIAKYKYDINLTNILIPSTNSLKLIKSSFKKIRK